MRHTKIVATLGPASESAEMIKALIEHGVDVIRLNFSHGTLDEQKERLRKVRAISESLGKYIPVMLDNRGPEIRIGQFANGEVMLSAGQTFVLTTRRIEAGDEHKVWVNYDGLPEDLSVGDRVLLDDGLLEMQVETISGPDVACRVIVGGVLSNRKKINVPSRQLNLPPLSPQDVEDLRVGVELGFDLVAASFIREAADVVAIRKVMESFGADIPIIAKIENDQGVKNAESILRVADGLMVARGDMGVEIPVEEVPMVQKRLISSANRAGKPVITATQMLDSMIRNPRPTRAEASDIANAIMDGTDAIMLSGETASGKYPIESVDVMGRIATRTESSLAYREIFLRRNPPEKATVTDAISHATVSAAADLNARAIITSTRSGSTAKTVAKYRPEAPVIAVTHDPKVARGLNLYWGVFPLVGEAVKDTDSMMNEAVRRAEEEGFVKSGDLVVLTAGVPAAIPGSTNLLKVSIVGDVVARGVGLGKRAIAGPVVVARNPGDAEKLMQPGAILVTQAVDRDWLPVLRRVSGIVTEEAGLTSDSAIYALNLDLPAILGVPGATSLLESGQVVTLDCARGLVYRGTRY